MATYKISGDVNYPARLKIFEGETYRGYKDITPPSYEVIFNEICNNLGEEMQEFLHVSKQGEISHDAMKKYLLTYKIGNLKESPIIYSKKVLETIKQISQNNPYIKNGNVIPFEESGPLMITTGRISSQKGFETIFEAIPRVIKHVPEAKFLFLLNPTSKNYMV